MRGFPLLSTLLVAAAFLIAWWPLRQLATNSEGDSSEAFEAHAHEGHEHDHEHDHGEPESPAGETLEIRIFASAPIKQLRIDHLGEVLAEESVASGEWEQVIDAIVIPPEGIEFWVEAELAERAAEGRVALGIEVMPGDRESITRTLWAEGNTVADSVVFTWPSE